MRLTQAAIVDDFSLSFFTEEATPTVVDSTFGIGTRLNAWLRFLSELSLVGPRQTSMEKIV